eukprot:CAMPEP_0175929312 /NCGR_PEP_ID=MMETSP0108-20121206/17704_1 /TAXON_ID=195067 ORGANISM="Goniomonas pacifica, Strain CCMP1869" /NCGR_SAMPLE_ID=MMETSP0108 /ASSEMBLY_ACC=CAM_ASM_000204 /LENGTH=206 /DNA_ID=CAMNT_0017252705 /DNA_START=96 /DNA_END=712 /DNA_ORIENTATION=-
MSAMELARYRIKCKPKADVGAPTLTLLIRDKTQNLVSVEFPQYILVEDDDTWTLQVGSQAGLDRNLFGTPFLQGWYTVFDMSDKRIGFSRAQGGQEARRPVPHPRHEEIHSTAPWRDVLRVGEQLVGLVCDGVGGGGNRPAPHSHLPLLGTTAATTRYGVLPFSGHASALQNLWRHSNQTRTRRSGLCASVLITSHSVTCKVLLDA